MSDVVLPYLNDGFPVYPIPPMFDALGKLDLGAVKKYVTYLEKKGARVFMTTQGTSQFDLLSPREVISLNELVAQTKYDFILGIPNQQHFVDNWLDIQLHAIESNSENTGIMFLYPGRFYDGTEMTEWFTSLAEKCEGYGLPMLIHGMWMRGGRGGIVDFPSSSIIELARHPNIIGMKEETRTIDSAMGILAEVNSSLDDDERFDIIVAGGSMRRFNALADGYRVKTWLTGVGNVYPVLEQYHDRFPVASLEAEKDFFEVTKKIGWHLALREAIRLAGIIDYHDRQPFPRCSESETAMLEVALKKAAGMAAFMELNRYE